MNNNNNKGISVGTDFKGYLCYIFKKSKSQPYIYIYAYIYFTDSKTYIFHTFISLKSEAVLQCVMFYSLIDSNTFSFFFGGTEINGMFTIDRDLGVMKYGR